MAARITIKELHAKTGEHVRHAGEAQHPLVITDRGVPVAVLAGNETADVGEDLNAIRGER